MVDNLHDRLQTQMYDVQGGPWTNIPKQVATPSHNVSTTGTRDEPNTMGTCQLNTSNLNENTDTNRNMVNNSSSQGSYDIVMLQCVTNYKVGDIIPNLSGHCPITINILSKFQSSYEENILRPKPPLVVQTSVGAMYFSIT